jgi:hypothetical protein
MMLAAFLCLFLGMIGVGYYLTRAALTKEEEDSLRAKLTEVKTDEMFPFETIGMNFSFSIERRALDYDAFSKMLDSQFTDDEILHVFHEMDKDSDNKVSKAEMDSYIDEHGKIKKEDLLKKKAEESSEKQESIRETLSTLGTTIMKLKITLTFVQCMSFMPLVFELPFPSTMSQTMKLLELSSLDIYVFFGEVSCHMQTTFKQKFVFHMLLLPIIFFCIWIVWKVVLQALKHKKKLKKHFEARFTIESMKTHMYTLVSLLVFGVYAGLATKTFQMFKCKEIQGRFYLVADFSVECYVGTWWSYAVFAILCIIVYVIGIPFAQLYVLWKHRKNLHENSAEDPQSHRLVKKQFGSLYENFTDDCYYFEIVNTFRRLLMTGGLILVGEQSVVQALLGILTCTIWLLLVVGKFPYASYWDNVLEISLSFAILMSLISGFALELYQLKETNGYEQAVFDVLLVIMVLMCIFAGVLSLIITLPFCRSRIVDRLKRGTDETKRHYLRGWVSKALPVVNYLNDTEIHETMDRCMQDMKAKSNKAKEIKQKERRLSKKEAQLEKKQTQVVPKSSKKPNEKV